MKMYDARTFNLPELKGLSQEQVAAHLGLYQGYVKHTNLLMEKIAAMRESEAEDNAYAIAEVRRRLGFEFNGMRLHEYYFEQFEGGAKALHEGGALAKAAQEKYGAQGGLMAHMKEVAGTRGIGWVIVYWDAVGEQLHTAFVNDHELGQLATLPIICALDLWEHAYMVDYLPSEKKKYLEAFFENLNWRVCEARFEEAAA